MFFPFLILSFLFFINFGFFFLSEEVLVFSFSLVFLSLLFLSLRSSARRYFFLRAYQVYVCFLYGLLSYIKGLKRMHLILHSLVSNLFLTFERKNLGPQALVSTFSLYWKSLEISFLARASEFTVGAASSFYPLLSLHLPFASLGNCTKSFLGDAVSFSF